MLVVIFVLVFLGEFGAFETQRLSYYDASLIANSVNSFTWSFLTIAKFFVFPFLHASVMHLILNSLTLMAVWIVACGLLPKVSSKQMLCLWYGSSLLVMLVLILGCKLFKIVNSEPLVGSSIGIMAIIGFDICGMIISYYFNNHSYNRLDKICRLFIILYLFYITWSTILSNETSSITTMMHLFGLIVGICYFFIFYLKQHDSINKRKKTLNNGK